MSEHRASLEKGNVSADSVETGGRLPLRVEASRVRAEMDILSDEGSTQTRRGSGDGMCGKESRRNTGSPPKQSMRAQTGHPRGQGLALAGGGEARSSEDAL